MSKKGKNNKVSIGGQALIEGIMMQGPKGAALSVRVPNGEIVTEEKNFTKLRDKYKFANFPLIRGIITFIESMIFGYKCLMESVEKSGLDEIENIENESKLDKWISEHLGEKLVPIISIVSTILGFGLAIGLFILLPSFLVDLFDKYVTDGTLERLHPFFEGVIRIIIFISYMFLVSLLPDIKRVFMYHGAEHKTIFCYECGKELTVENVKKQRRFHPRCGTSFIFLTIILSILISSVFVLIFPKAQALTDTIWLNSLIWSAIKILLIPLIMGVCYEFIRLAGKYDNVVTKILSAPGMWMQRITTKEPTDDIIEVGIEALKAVLNDDDKLKNAAETQKGDNYND